jgi:hypothetical protein
MGLQPSGGPHVPLACGSRCAGTWHVVVRRPSATRPAERPGPVSPPQRVDLTARIREVLLNYPE